MVVSRWVAEVGDRPSPGGGPIAAAVSRGGWRLGRVSSRLLPYFFIKKRVGFL
jgi:hypothetical protein